MSTPAPSSTSSNMIGDATEGTWAAVRSTLFPMIELGDSGYPGIYDHNKVYPLSVNGDETNFNLVKCFAVEEPFPPGIIFNLPIGVNYVPLPFIAPSPNPNNLNGLWRPKLCIGIGTSAVGYTLLVQQGTVINPTEIQTLNHQLGYDYETTKAALIGTEVNVTCRFWPIPYPRGTVTPQEFTATVTIDATMFPANQDFNINSNRTGGITIFIGSGNYTTGDSPTLFPPNPFTINWIQFPT